MLDASTIQEIRKAILEAVPVVADAFGNEIALGDVIAVAQEIEVALGPTLSNTERRVEVCAREVTYISATGIPYYRDDEGKLQAARPPIYVVRA